MTVSAETHAKLLRVRDLLRHAIPNGDEAAIFDRALTVLLEQLEKKKFAARKPKAAPKTSTDATPGGKARRASLRRAEGPAVARVERRVRDVRRGKVGAGITPQQEGGEATSAGSAPPPAAARSRYIAAAVRREVWARSQGQCEFVADGGRRCEQRGFLEFHHHVPFAAGGVSTSSNLSIRCRSHNQHEAELFFGADAVRDRRRAGEMRLTDASTATRSVVSPSLATVNCCRDHGVPPELSRR